MLINVFNADELVFTGPLEEFLADNAGDDYVAEECSKLEQVDRVELLALTGHWVVERQ